MTTHRSLGSHIIVIIKFHFRLVAEQRLLKSSYDANRGLFCGINIINLLCKFTKLDFILLLFLSCSFIFRQSSCENEEAAICICSASLSSVNQFSRHSSRFLSKAIAGPVYRYVEDRWSLKYWEIKMSKERLDSICFGFEEGDMKAWKVWTAVALVLYYLLRPLLYIVQLRQLHSAVIDLKNLTNINFWNHIRTY